MKRQRFLAKGGAAASRGGDSGPPKRNAGGATAAPFGSDPCQGRPAPPQVQTSALGGGQPRGRAAGGLDAPSPTGAEPPSSPLSRLVHDGYAAPTQQNPVGGSSLPPRAPGGRRPGAGANFDAGVAQQWSTNVQQTTESYQQQHDPNFAGKFRKPQGYRVSQAPGGGSSISLSWNGETPPSAAGGSGTAAQRYSSPALAASPSSKAAMRNPSPLRQAGMRAASPSPAMRAASPSPAMRAPSPSRGDDMSRHRAPSPSPQRQLGAVPGADRPLPTLPAPARDLDTKGCNFGSALSGRASSNAYACGGNQNCGNGITDRRMTRINRPPGGGSSVVFG